jgi:hypothetical protein
MLAQQPLSDRASLALSKATFTELIGVTPIMQRLQMFYGQCNPVKLGQTRTRVNMPNFDRLPAATQASF